jgi:hypothetical protein
LASATKCGSGTEGVPVVDEHVGGCFVNLGGVGGYIVASNAVVRLLALGLVALLGLGSSWAARRLSSDAFDSKNPPLDTHAGVLEPLLEGGKVGGADRVVVGLFESAEVLVVGACDCQKARRD